MKAGPKPIEVFELLVYGLLFALIIKSLASLYIELARVVFCKEEVDYRNESDVSFRRVLLLFYLFSLDYI